MQLVFCVDKMLLIILNMVLFYIAFHHAAYIYFSFGIYRASYGLIGWIYRSQWSFLLASAVAAAVFFAVGWTSMRPPAKLVPVILLVAAPAAFFLIFGELVSAML